MAFYKAKFLTSLKVSNWNLMWTFNDVVICFDDMIQRIKKREKENLQSRIALNYLFSQHHQFKYFFFYVFFDPALDQSTERNNTEKKLVNEKAKLLK